MDKYINITEIENLIEQNIAIYGKECALGQLMIECRRFNEWVEDQVKKARYELSIIDIKRSSIENDRQKTIIEMADLYNSGHTYQEVGNAFGISGQRVEQILKKHNIEIRPKNKYSKIFEEWHSTIVDLYSVQRLSVPSIAKQIGVPHAALWRYINRKNITKPKLTKNDIPLITNLYLNEGKTIPEIEQCLNISRTMIANFIKEHSIKKEIKKHVRWGDILTKELLTELYIKEKMTVYQIAKFCATGQKTITYHLKKHNLYKKK